MDFSFFVVEESNVTDFLFLFLLFLPFRFLAERERLQEPWEEIEAVDEPLTDLVLLLEEERKLEELGLLGLILSLQLLAILEPVTVSITP